jgi:hypothetical protein
MQQLTTAGTGGRAHGNAPLGVGKSGHATGIAAGPVQYCISGAARETGRRSSPPVVLLSAAEMLDTAGGREAAAVEQGKDVTDATSYSCARPALLLTTACSWSL